MHLLMINGLFFIISTASRSASTPHQHDWGTLPQEILNNIAQYCVVTRQACDKNCSWTYKKSKDVRQMALACKHWNLSVRPLMNTLGVQYGSFYSSHDKAFSPDGGGDNALECLRQHKPLNKPWCSRWCYFLPHLELDGFYEPPVPTLRGVLCAALFYERRDYPLTNNDRTAIDTIAQNYGLQELLCLQDAYKSHRWWHVRLFRKGWHYIDSYRHYDADDIPLAQLTNQTHCGKIGEYIAQKIREEEAKTHLSLRQKIGGLFNRYIAAPIADGRYHRILDNWIVPGLLKSASIIALSRIMPKVVACMHKDSLLFALTGYAGYGALMAAFGGLFCIAPFVTTLAAGTALAANSDSPTLHTAAYITAMFCIQPFNCRRPHLILEY
jgi:hypothetical protein